MCVSCTAGCVCMFNACDISKHAHWASERARERDTALAKTKRRRTSVYAWLCVFMHGMGGQTNMLMHARSSNS